MYEEPSPAEAGSWVPLRVYAAARGVTPAAVLKALKAGKLGLPFRQKNDDARGTYEVFAPSDELKPVSDRSEMAALDAEIAELKAAVEQSRAAAEQAIATAQALKEARDALQQLVDMQNQAAATTKALLDAAEARAAAVQAALEPVEQATGIRRLLLWAGGMYRLTPVHRG